MVQEVTPEHIKELSTAIEYAKEGYWMPLAIICALFMIIIVLLVVQWTNYKNNNEKRHTENETLTKELAKGNVNLSIIIERHETEINNLKERRK